MKEQEVWCCKGKRLGRKKNRAYADSEWLTGWSLVISVGVAQDQLILPAAERVAVDGHRVEVNVRIAAFGLVRGASVVVPHWQLWIGGKRENRGKWGRKRCEVKKGEHATGVRGTLYVIVTHDLRWSTIFHIIILSNLKRDLQWLASFLSR